MIADVAAQETAAVRAQAIRQLLDSPMVGRADNGFTGIAVHESWLREWFADTCGWILHTDVRRGFARLAKISPAGGCAPPARGAGDWPFDRRTYVLLCVLAAALGEHSRARISLKAIAESVTDMTLRAGVRTYDPDHPKRAVGRGERRRLLRAIGLLESLGILAERHRVGGDYIQDRVTNVETNVLYEIDERRLALLIAAPVPPALASSWTDLLNTGSGDEHEEQDRPGRRRRALHRVMRHLLDEAVCDLGSLDEDERQCLNADLPRIKGWLADAGMELECRAEYWAAVDTGAAPARMILPKDTIAANAALLLASHIVTKPGRWVHERAAHDFIAGVFRDHPRWAKTFREDGGQHRLTAQALGILSQLGLVARDAEGWQASPASHRWVLTVESEPPPRPVAVDDENQQALFPEEDL